MQKQKTLRNISSGFCSQTPSYSFWRRLCATDPSPKIAGVSLVIALPTQGTGDFLTDILYKINNEELNKNVWLKIS